MPLIATAMGNENTISNYYFYLIVRSFVFLKLDWISISIFYDLSIGANFFCVCVCVFRSSVTIHTFYCLILFIISFPIPVSHVSLNTFFFSHFYCKNFDLQFCFAFASAATAVAAVLRFTMCIFHDVCLSKRICWLSCMKHNL